MPNRVQKQIIKDALDEPEKLTDWENEFIASVAEIEDDQELTQKQNAVLNRISQKLF